MRQPHKLSGASAGCARRPAPRPDLRRNPTAAGPRPCYLLQVPTRRRRSSISRSRLDVRVRAGRAGPARVVVHARRCGPVTSASGSRRPSAGPAMNNVGRYRERARAAVRSRHLDAGPRTVKATRPESETPKSSTGPMNAVGPPVSGQDTVVTLAANALFEHDRLRPRGPRLDWLLEGALNLQRIAASPQE